MHERLQGMGIKVGYSTVKDYVANIKKRGNVFVRVNTSPGVGILLIDKVHQLQVILIHYRL